MGDPSVCCVVMYGIGHCPAAWDPPPPPPFSLSASTLLAAARPQGAVKWLLWLNRIWKRKKNRSPILHSSFSFSRYLFSLAMWCWLYPRIGRRMLTLREIKLLKQRRKKSGLPCGVDFKRELTSSVLTSLGFHCNVMRPHPSKWFPLKEPWDNFECKMQNKDNITFFISAWYGLWCKILVLNLS